MATFGIIRSKTVGYPFTGARRPQNASRAIFRQMLGGNREPASVAPIRPLRWHGSSDPVHIFPIQDAAPPATRVNQPSTIRAGGPIVKSSIAAFGRASRKA